MIGYLHGFVKYIGNDSCILDVQGVGYRVYITAATRNKLKLQQELELYTYLAVREDALILYGFEEVLDYDVFCRLITVSKIGPKLALTMLSSASAMDIVSIIRNKHLVKLTSIPGIGKKTGERIIMELQDKFDDIILPATASTASILPQIEEPLIVDDSAEVSAALQSLGYTNQEIKAISKKLAPDLSVEDKIREALKLLMNK